jgi:hypothetical protein
MMSHVFSWFFVLFFLCFDALIFADSIWHDSEAFFAVANDGGC